MSQYDRSSLDRLTPELEIPGLYDDSDPLDFPLEDQIPYDSFDDESFVIDSQSVSSAHSISTAPSDEPEEDDLRQPSYHSLPARGVFFDLSDEFFQTLIDQSSEMDFAEAIPEPDGDDILGRRTLRHRRASGVDRGDLPGGSAAGPRSAAQNAPRQQRGRRNPQDELVDVEVYRRREERSRPAASAEVIDLTAEPDSPGHSVSESRPALQNPRRQTSHARAAPPSLARSDSSILGGVDRSHVIIDLTEDDSDIPRPQPAPRLPGSPELLFVEQRPRLPPFPPPHRPRHNPPRRLVAFPALDGLRRGLAGGLHLFDLLNPMFAHPDAPVEPFNPVGPIDLHYEHHPFNRSQPSPKPIQEVPPPARAGFTRNTDPETAFVCPGCNEELAYDPDDTNSSDLQHARPSRGKRSRSEHHFWALKNCGHVYCADCFENRRTSSKRPKTVFPNDSGDGKTLVCAVDDCDSHVSQKTAWVGIYM